MREHDEYNCQCHETCSWCCDSWPIGQLRGIEVNGEHTDGVCPPCRKDARKREMS